MMIIIQLQSPPKIPRLSLHLSSHLLPKPKPSPQQKRRIIIIQQLEPPPNKPLLHLSLHLLSHPQFVAVTSLMLILQNFFYSVSYDRMLDLFPIQSKDFAYNKRQETTSLFDWMVLFCEIKRTSLAVPHDRSDAQMVVLLSIKS